MRVAIIGGGVAGLSAATELLRRGADPVVFEAAGRAGGKIASRSDRGWLTEDGPHFIAREMDSLVEAAGVRGEVVVPEGAAARWVHIGGKVLRAPSLRLLMRAGLARALAEPLFARPPRDGESLLDFMIARLGAKAGGLAAALMAGGVYAGDPARLSAQEAFPSVASGRSLLRRLGSRAIWSLRGGLGTLPLRLAERLGARVRLGNSVAELAPADGSSSWDVAGEIFEAVVLAVPAPAAASLLQDFAPDFGRAIAGLRAAPVAVVHLGFGGDEIPRGFGVIDADGALHAVGTLFPASLLPGRAPAGKALATAICGGARHPERAALPDSELLSRVLGELKRLLGVRRDPEYLRVVRHAEGIPQYEPGHGARVRAARAALSAFPRIEIAGGWYDGVSVPDVAESGAAAAARLMGDER